ncbi:hypothetical protein RYX36_013733, partial [Vicia faba]
ATQCAIVNEIRKIISAPRGWYYKACHDCPRHAKGYKPPYIFSVDHKTETEIYKYKFFIEVVNDGCRATFVLWDRECTQLLEVTAAQMRTTRLEVGIADPLEYLLKLDYIVGTKDHEMTSKVFSEPMTPTSYSKRVATPISDEISQATGLCDGEQSSTKVKKAHQIREVI